MKTRTTRRFWTIAALLLFALPCPSNAMPPVPHRIKGGIERIDGDQGELVITNASGRVTLTWKESARFENTCLSPGDQIKTYYRKEEGRLVIRDVQSVVSSECRHCK